MAPVIPIGLGCMRLSTLPERDDDAAIATLHAALDAGVALLDTANVYCLDDGDIGHNERLVATALARWGGDRTAITIATKGGLTRPGGAWVPDGRAKALRAACEASCSALGVLTTEVRDTANRWEASEGAVGTALVIPAEPA